ncbi:DUF2510 domain-containing protein [Mycolicibacterium smegmatis]|uniref:DUF2510 domain-containing protein n=1 Tax=Mycolicibacterium smegmatis TaxID=1772 RepID=UPI001E478A58|nr:DUF2510 domain-containing protein [Mycolicibacterium smegmatis]
MALICRPWQPHRLSPPAGWYPDPDGAPTQRYFDGKKWTDQLAPLAAPARADDGYSTKSSAVAEILGFGTTYRALGWTITPNQRRDHLHQ